MKEIEHLIYRMEGITKFPPSDEKILEKINEVIDRLNLAMRMLVKR